MSRVSELFGYSSDKDNKEWQSIIENQQCPFINKRCYKVRKSDPNIPIGTCTVSYGRPLKPVKQKQCLRQQQQKPKRGRQQKQSGRQRGQHKKSNYVRS